MSRSSKNISNFNIVKRRLFWNQYNCSVSSCLAAP